MPSTKEQKFSVAFSKQGAVQPQDRFRALWRAAAMAETASRFIGGCFSCPSLAPSGNPQTALALDL